MPFIKLFWIFFLFFLKIFLGVLQHVIEFVAFFFCLYSLAKRLMLRLKFIELCFEPMSVKQRLLFIIIMCLVTVYLYCVVFCFLEVGLLNCLRAFFIIIDQFVYYPLGLNPNPFNIDWKKYF